MPELYRSITFLASDEHDLLDLGVDAFLTRNTRHMKHVKELHFTSWFHGNLRHRCPGVNGFGHGDDNNDGGFVHGKFFQALNSQLSLLFSFIKDNALQRFRFVALSPESDPDPDVDVVAGI